ncbi:MAG: PilZ domain-containing protein [Terriglobia bacterium]
MQRAQRFAVEIPIRYRETGSADWQEGTTVNISASGILFRSARSFRPRTALDVALTLPVAISGEAPAEIGCHGAVVRVVRDSSRPRMPMLAVSIARYRFVHKRRARAMGDRS